MDPFESYKLYNALKLHFESGYDAVKYNFKSNVSQKTFFKRRDKYFFAKLAKKYNGNLKDYYISNFKMGLSYVGDMMDDDGERNYKDHLRIQESIHRVFSVDINRLREEDIIFDGLFQSVDVISLTFYACKWLCCVFLIHCFISLMDLPLLYSLESSVVA